MTYEGNYVSFTSVKHSCVAESRSCYKTMSVQLQMCMGAVLQYLGAYDEDFWGWSKRLLANN